MDGTVKAPTSHMAEGPDQPRTDERVPVTILTGFLGAGKTTLLNHILTATHGKKIAIIENEFGDTSIDDKLIAKNSQFHSDEEIVETLNGCICCSVRQDLIAILKKLAGRSAAGELRLDRRIQSFGAFLMLRICARNRLSWPSHALISGSVYFSRSDASCSP